MQKVRKPSSPQALRIRTDERGVALLMTLFVVTLLTILVIELVENSQLDLRVSRAFSERIQSDYYLKSLVNYGRIIVAMPKAEDENGVPINADWLGDPWSQVQSELATLAFPGNPEVRLKIVDDYAKININSILENDDQNHLWKDRLAKIFEAQGFFDEEYEEEEFRTPGNKAYEANNQVAVIRDFIDTDKDSLRIPGFIGEGIESTSKKEFFLNKGSLKNISELQYVPGMTSERLYRIAPYIATRFNTNTNLLNVNTVDPITFAATCNQASIGEIESILELRPIQGQVLTTINQGVCNGIFQSFSAQFTMYAQVVMPNETRWLRAVVIPIGSVTNRTGTQLREIGFY